MLAPTLDYELQDGDCVCVSPLRIYAAADDPLAIPVKPFSKVPRQALQWLWQGRIPLGKLTLLTGDGDVGKSLLTCDMAARVTRGLAFPDSPEDSGAKHQGSVLLFESEDGENDTIRPRLDAAGVDVTKVFTPQNLGFHLDITKDCDALERTIVAIGDCRLLILSPISEFMGKTNARSNSAVRTALFGLRVLTEKYRLATVLISHFNKKGSGANTNNRVIDSVALPNAARGNLVFCKYQTHDKRALFCEKHNLSGDADARPLVFRILVDDTKYPYLDFLPDEQVTMTAAECLADMPKPKGPPPLQAMSAAEFLQHRLAEGPVAGRVLVAEAAELTPEPISRATLYRARDELGITTVDGKWTLPTAEA
jgi:putative DNA primase/helicase